MADVHPFEVLDYSIEALERLLSAKSDASPEIVHEKLHSLYFQNYFDALKAKTIVVENEYIDRDFLEDFSGYYVRCFPAYQRKCSRLHFFSCSFSSHDFEQLLEQCQTENDAEHIKSAYLGSSL